MITSVIIPTFNRGPLLRGTLEHVLRSRLPEGGVEVVVVDDGSSIPAEAALSNVVVAPPFSLRVLRQQNAGPAAARNAGFRAAGGRICLFLDDDILVRPDLVARHVETHVRFPSSIVFGLCPFSPDIDSPLLRYMTALNAPSDSTPYQQADRVASGHLSVERDQFVASGGLYREDLRTPAAEEFELSYRLRTTGVPIIFAPDIVGIHLQPVDLPTLCTQQYKYGVGLAEAAAKCADLQGMPELQAILAENQAPRLTDSLGVAGRKFLKNLLGRHPARRGAEASVRVLERVWSRGSFLPTAYRTLLGASFYAGLQEGRRLYPPA